MTGDMDYMLTQIVDMRHYIDTMGWLDWWVGLLILAVIWSIPIVLMKLSDTNWGRRHASDELAVIVIIGDFLLSIVIILVAVDVYFTESEYTMMCETYRAIYGPLPWD